MYLCKTLEKVGENNRQHFPVKKVLKFKKASAIAFKGGVCHIHSKCPQ
jgi:hypothetical protein